jgi:hypothetical protein
MHYMTLIEDEMRHRWINGEGADFTIKLGSGVYAKLINEINHYQPRREDAEQVAAVNELRTRWGTAHIIENPDMVGFTITRGVPPSTTTPSSADSSSSDSPPTAP